MHVQFFVREYKCTNLMLIELYTGFVYCKYIYFDDATLWNRMEKKEGKTGISW